MAKAPSPGRSKKKSGQTNKNNLLGQADELFVVRI
jgi:hypothetical protein